ncbi:MAG TPA: hypothetical protein VF364_05630 [Candidatus Limnocylindria bacterium]
MTVELDRLVDEHLARMPDEVRMRLAPMIATDAADSWAREALRAYLRYFTRLFEGGDAPASAEAALADDLANLAGTLRAGDAEAEIEDAEASLRAGFADRGLRFLGGRTPPHFGAYVWSRTEARRFTVTLPGGDPEEVTVHFMHDFLIRGWLHWKTFGKEGAGGWYQQGDPAWDDGLYCVADRYPEPLDRNRTFQVSLLGHEAQHVADHRAFPGLSSAELEYRAKLVELIGYGSVDDRLRFFLADAADDPTQPHPFAAHRIVGDLAGRLFDRSPNDDDWASVAYGDIRRHAEELLSEDTARLRQGG